MVPTKTSINRMRIGCTSNNSRTVVRNNRFFEATKIKCTFNQRLLVSETQSFLYVFFMFVNTCLHVRSQCHDVTSALIAIQRDSLCANCRFLKTGLVDDIGVLQTPMNSELCFSKIMIQQQNRCYVYGM